VKGLHAPCRRTLEKLDPVNNIKLSLDSTFISFERDSFRSGSLGLPYTMRSVLVTLFISLAGFVLISAEQQPGLFAFDTQLCVI